MCTAHTLDNDLNKRSQLAHTPVVLIKIESLVGDRHPEILTGVVGLVM